MTMNQSELQFHAGKTTFELTQSLPALEGNNISNFEQIYEQYQPDKEDRRWQVDVHRQTFKIVKILQGESDVILDMAFTIGGHRALTLTEFNRLLENKPIVGDELIREVIE